MAEIKGNLISELPSTTLDGTEQIPVEKNGANNSVTVNEVKEFVKQSIPSGGTSDYNQLQNKPSINNVELNGNVDINADTIKVKYSPTGNPFEEEQVSLSQTVGSVSGRLSEIQNEASQCTSKINTLKDETIPSIEQEIASLGTRIPTNVSELINDSDFATNAEVQRQIADAQLGGGDVDTSGFATKEELNAKADKTAIADMLTKTEAASTYQKKGNYALKSEIPSTENLATKQEVTAVEGQIPTQTSQLQNNSNYVADASYVHTDNNYTTAEKEKLGRLQELEFVEVNEGDTFRYSSPVVPEPEVQDIIVDQMSVNVDEGESAIVRVSLATAPKHNLIVNLSKDNDDVTLNPQSLTFTAENYGSPQNVTIVVTQDADSADDICNVSLINSESNLRKTIVVNITDLDADTPIPSEHIVVTEENGYMSYPVVNLDFKEGSYGTDIVENYLIKNILIDNDKESNEIFKNLGGIECILEIDISGKTNKEGLAVNRNGVFYNALKSNLQNTPIKEYFQQKLGGTHITYLLRSNIQRHLINPVGFSNFSTRASTLENSIYCRVNYNSGIESSRNAINSLGVVMGQAYPWTYSEENIKITPNSLEVCLVNRLKDATLESLIDFFTKNQVHIWY